MARVWKPKPINWCSAFFTDRLIPIDFTSPDLDPILARMTESTMLAAYTDFDADPWRVMISASEPRATYADTLLHELQHIAYRLYKGRGRVTRFWQYEERAVKILTPGLLAVLWSLGWRLPPLPRGLKRLEQHACMVRYGSQQRED